MKNLNNNVFLSKIKQRIRQGDFDVHFTLPFMTRDLLFSSIKGRIDKRVATGGTPILNDNEIKDCLAEVKETAMNIIAIYLKLGFMKRTENGFEFSEKFYLGVKVAYKS